MIRIAILNNEEQQGVDILVALCAYREKKAYNMLLEKLDAGFDPRKIMNCYDIYLVDTDLVNPDAIELAERIRAAGDDAAIIFYNGNEERAWMAYRLWAVDYLLKPFCAEDLQESLDRVVASMEKQSGMTSFAIKTRDGVKVLRINDFLYAKTENRVICYHMRDGSLFRSLSMRSSFKEEVSSLLADRRGCMAGCGMVINLEYVRNITAEDIIMSNGELLKAPKYILPKLYNEWLRYLEL